MTSNMLARGILSAICIFAVPLASWAMPITIYSDDFSGLVGTNLNGTAPDVKPGAQTWAAGTDWKANGSKSNAGTAQSANLPFSPAANKIYDLSIDVNPTGGADSSNWFGVAYGTASNNGALNLSSTYAWILQRINRTGNSNQSFTGMNTDGGAPHNPDPDNLGLVNLKVRLDTNPTLWTAQWFVNNVSVRGPETINLVSNPVISHVRFGSHLSSGSVDNFLLVEVPEPATWCLSVIGLLGIAAVSRRRRA